MQFLIQLKGRPTGISQKEADIVFRNHLIIDQVHNRTEISAPIDSVGYFNTIFYELWNLVDKIKIVLFYWPPIIYLKRDIYFGNQGSISKVGSKEKNNFLCALNYIDE
jgi:hypothetical protein